MASPSHISLPAKLNLNASNIATDWKQFHEQWLNYVKAAKVDQKAATCQAAILLACIGTGAYCVYESMTLAYTQRASTIALPEAFQRHGAGNVSNTSNTFSTVGNKEIVKSLWPIGDVWCNPLDSWTMNNPLFVTIIREI